MDIRARIRQVLDENPELSLRSVSLKAGFSDSMLSKFMNPDKKGGIQSLTTDALDRVAQAMGVNPRWLAYGEGLKTIDPKVANLWDRISDEQKPRVLRVLESFVDDAEDNQA